VRVLLVLLLLLVAAPGRSAEGAETAVCPVCRVREGTSAPEPVRAVRELGGVRYGFCSSACAAEFDRDPRAYLPAAGGASRAPADSVSAASPDSLPIVPLADFGDPHRHGRTSTAPT
jgi:YHS domain-containing protein